MLIKYLNCFKLISYALHLLTVIKCSAGQSASPTLKQLEEIELSLDETVDPCQNFYRYTCTNWPNHGKRSHYYDITGKLDHIANMQMIRVIRQQTGNRSQSFIGKTYNYYKSCDRERVGNITRYFDSIKPCSGLEWPLVHVLQASLRGVASDSAGTEWSADHFDVFAILGRLQGYGLDNVLISQEIAPTQIGSLQILLQMPYMTKTDIIPSPALMVLLKGLGLPEGTARKYAKEIKITENHWLEVYSYHLDSYINEPVILTYQEVKRLHPPLARFVEHIIPKQIQRTKLVSIHNMDYFQFLMNYTWGPMEPQAILNYIMVKFLIHLMEDSPKHFTSHDCIKDLRNKMGLSVNYLYYENIYQPHSFQYNHKMSELTTKLSHYYGELLDENFLNFNVEQLELLKQKLVSVSINLGNLPTNLNINQIEEFYSDLPPLELGNYYKNHLQLLRHRFHKSLLYHKNQSFVIPTGNRMGSSSAPIYIAKHNTVILPMEFLQPPIFHSEYHPIFVFSMMGFLLAREIALAIGTAGLQYDKDGSLLDSDKGILKHPNFNAFLDCMKKQKAIDTINDRLSDLVGARLAYMAHIREYNWQLQPEILGRPWKKLFFLNMGHFFCGRKVVPFFDRDADAVRLNQLVMNLESFAEAFQCPVGASKMNPMEKCRLY